MSRRASGPARQRLMARALHIVAGLALGAFVYMPAVYAEPMRLALQFVVIPLAVATGLLLWKQAAIRRLLSGRRARRAAG